MSKDLTVAVVGATGAVGAEMFACLEERNFPLGELVPLASARSAGKKLTFRGTEVVVRELTPDAFKGVDVALFSAGGGISKEFAPHAVAADAVVVDNSSAFRLDSKVPLIVPEINPQEVGKMGKGIIANPNCTTIISLMALFPLHQKFGVKSVIASSYQAVSGSGAQGILELDEQIAALANGKTCEPKVYPRQIASNVIPQVDVFTENGYSKEEMKMQNEGGKIMGLNEFKASMTCVRVPVHRSHSVAISANFENPVDLEAAREAIQAAPGVQLVDDRENLVYPTPLDCTGKDDCLVGRMREDLVFKNGLSFWVVGDQVRKGAALNAVQIAELL